MRRISERFSPPSRADFSTLSQLELPTKKKNDVKVSSATKFPVYEAIIAVVAAAAAADAATTDK